MKNLHFQRQGFELNIPHWEIPDEGMSWLSGSSGSGKTTLVNILLGLVPCPKLKWIFKNEDLAKLPLQKRNLGVVFQSLDLFPHMSALQNMLFAMKARQLPLNKPHPNASLQDGKSPLSFIEFLIESLEIGVFKNKKVGELSGGERQRVAIGRALAGQPRILFLDEAFSSLDEELKAKTRSIIKKVVSEVKTPTIMISHDAQDGFIADHHFVLKSGKIHQN